MVAFMHQKQHEIQLKKVIILEDQLPTDSVLEYLFY